MTSTEPQGDQSTETDRPQQFKAIADWLHAERERVNGEAGDWQPNQTLDTRDTRSAQLLGETLLRMQSSLGPLSVRQDILELRG